MAEVGIAEYFSMAEALGIIATFSIFRESKCSPYQWILKQRFSMTCMTE
jgi:hypothetical protein